MTFLSKKPRFNQFISSLLLVLLLVIILDLVFSSTASVSSVTSPFAYANSKVKIAEESKEAMALLNWKLSLHNTSQSLLSSWVGTTPCNWVGINCDQSGSVTHLNLSSYGLIGTLHNLSFQSFPNLLSLDLSDNSLYGIIPSNICHLFKLSFLNHQSKQQRKLQIYMSYLMIEVGAVVLVLKAAALVVVERKSRSHTLYCNLGL